MSAPDFGGVFRKQAMGKQWKCSMRMGDKHRAKKLSSGRGGQSSGSSGTAAGSGFEVDGSYRDAIQEGCLHAHQRTVLNGASMYG